MDELIAENRFWAKVQKTEGLIQQLEKAEAGSRELDARIWWETHETPEGHIPLANCLGDAIEAAKEGRVSASGSGRVEHYTTSLDAALKLVPEDHGWQIESYGAASVHSLEKSPDRIGYLIVGEAGLTDPIATPALALCIASLRATKTALKARRATLSPAR